MWSAVLEVRDPDGTRTRHPFRHPRIQVGRRRDNDLSLADEGVSHAHCEFVAEDGWFLVRDLGSQNGTFVNDRKIAKEARLRDGDEVRIGATRIRIALDGAVRRPNRRSRWRVGAVLGLLALGAALWGLSRQREAARASYAASVRAELSRQTCALPQFEELDRIDAQIGGRSLALTSRHGELQPTQEDLALDRELQALDQRKLALYQDAVRAIDAAQEPRREVAERLSRLGRRLWTARERRAAAFVDGLLQERVEAADELSQALRQQLDDTAALIALVGALPQSAGALRDFRFRSDLRAARAACEQKDAAASAGLSGALAGLAE